MLHAALELPANERPRFLGSACAGDTDLRREVESLLDQASEGSGFLSTPAGVIGGASPSREMSLVGRQLGRYTVRERLGSGGMGEVYLAEDTQLRRPVALKALYDDGVITPEGRRRLLREAQAVAALNHPNIAAIYDLIDVTGDAVTPPHLVMEYVAGETLSARLKRGPLPVAEALRVCREVADALAATHRQGIIHRDLKPANLQLAADGRVKVLDFGLARRIPSMTDTTGLTTDRGPLSHADLRIAGTPGYMSPEQALGRPVGTPTDVFSLGIVLFEMLAGHRPRPGEEVHPVSLAMSTTPTPPAQSTRPSVATAVDMLVTKMLAIEAGDRPSAADVVTEIDRLLRPDSVDAQAPATAPRRRGLTYAAGTAAVAIMLAAGAMWWRTAHAPVPRPVIAVLPLVNLTGDSAKDYVGIGIAETLTTSLARVRSVSLISRTGLADLPRGTADVRTIARDLGATLLLQGSVQTSGDRFRVNAKLVKPDGSIAWAGEADARAGDLFALQSRLAESLIAGLSVSVSAQERQTAIASPTQNPQALEAYWQGLAFMDRADASSIQSAIMSFENATSLDPKFASAFGALGESYRRQYVLTNDRAWITKAMAAVSRGVALDPARDDVRVSLAALYTQTGRLDEAANELRTIIQQSPGNDDAHGRLGAVLNRMNKPDQALIEYQAAVALRPQYWRNHQGIGNFYYSQRRFSEAVAAFSRVLEIRPDDATTLLQRGVSFHAMGDRARARADYERSIRINPTGATYSNLGTLAFQDGRFEDAVRAFSAAIQLTPKRALYHRNLGDAYLKLRREPDAQSEYLAAIRLSQEALGVDPTDANTLSQLAVYEAKVGRTKEARQHVDEAVSRNTSPDILFRRGVTLALIGDTDAAVSALRVAVDHGYSVEQLRTEDDLARLAKIPAFQQLLNTKSAR